jgi:hypothetical protein
LKEFRLKDQALVTLFYTNVTGKAISGSHPGLTWVVQLLKLFLHLPQTS